MDHLPIGLERSQALEGPTLGRGVREEGRRAVAEASLSPFLILEHGKWFSKSVQRSDGIEKMM